MYVVREDGRRKNARGAEACTGSLQEVADGVEEVHIHAAGLCRSENAVAIDLNIILARAGAQVDSRDTTSRYPNK